MLKVLSYLHVALIVMSLLVSCDIINGDKGNASGEIVWSVENEYTNSGGKIPLIDGDRVFVFHDGFLRSYRLKDGELLWSQTILSGGATRLYSINQLIDKDNIYIDTGYDYRAYSKVSGQLKYRKEFTTDGFEFAGLGAAQISQNEDYLFLPRKRRVLQVQKHTGSIVKEFPLDYLIPEGVEQGATNPLPSPYGNNILYVPTVYWDTVNEPNKRTGNLFAFDISTGELLWEFKGPDKVMPTEEFEATDSLAIGSPMNEIKLTQEYVVVASNPTVMLLDRMTGELIWQIPLKYRRFAGYPGEENSFDGVLLGLAVDPSGIYVTSLSGLARKLNWSDGSEIWSVDIKFTSGTLLTLQKRNLYFNNDGGGGIWVIDAMSGEVIFNSNPPGHQQNSHDVYLSSLAVGNGYMVNVGHLRLYALRSFD